MYPSGPAPSPPSKIPAGHPFATYYIPSTGTTSPSISSKTVPPSPSTSSTSSRQTTSTASASRDSDIGRRVLYPTTEPACRPAYSTLPTDLSLLDHQPRQTLLVDLEYIIGKKLHFPLLTRKASASSQLKSKDKANNKEATAKEIRGSGGSTTSSRRLRKQREHSWEEDFAWDGVRLVDDKNGERKGRGVREGNWV